MKLAQYTRAERSIAATDGNTIRERWLYGLRLLADEEKLAPKGGLRHGVADALALAAKSHGIALSALEIRRRLQCARTYPTEAQIDHVMIDFKTWFDLIQAGFPAVERPAGEPDADYLSTNEKRHAAANRLAQYADPDQLELFPLDQYDPDENTLKDLETYAEEMRALTARFAERDRDRARYLEDLISAAGGDLSCLWGDAHRAAFPDEDGPE